MKKVLFATTALVATAGVAAAEVALKGSAEIGIIGGDGIETQFFTDIDVTFTMTGEADNGLTFGASIDLDESDGNPSAAFGGTTQGGESIFIAYGGLRLDMGDTDGAFDAAMQEVGIGGSINDDQESDGFNGNSGLDGTYDGQIARVSYTMNNLSTYLSVEMDDTGAGDPVLGLGAKWSTQAGSANLTVGLGYQTVSIGAFDADVVGVSLDAKFDSGLRATINYYEGDTDLGGVDETHTAIGIGYTMNALTVGFNYGVTEEGIAEQDGFGIAVNYDLGGGLVAQFGYGSSDNNGFCAYAGCAAGDSFSLGLAMSF